MTITTILTRRSLKKRSTTTALLGYFVALMAVGLMLLVGASDPARASTTFTVNTTSDSSDGFCNAQHCSLREAIAIANATPNSGGPDMIHFNIGGDTPQTIFVNSELPIISSPVIIDGYTQPGASPNTLVKGTNAKLMIELNGENAAGLFVSGLEIGNRLFDASGTVVRGLVINGFSDAGIAISGTSTAGVRVEGNFIGTDASGDVDLGNDFSGVVVVEGASNNVVGGSKPDQRNLISGNGSIGGVVIGQGSVGNKVLGNLIGTQKDGIRRLGNSGDGVSISSGSTNNVVGGSSPDVANTIAFNGSDGVEVLGEGSTNNRIMRNSIFANGELGIDLVLDSTEGGQIGDGPTANDPGDADTGPNGLQNNPTLTSAMTASGKTTIKGKLSTKANQSYVVRFFSNPSGNEGKKFIGQRKVTTGSDGKVSFTFSPAQKVGAGKTVTATTTGSEGTSEFSAARKVLSP